MKGLFRKDLYVLRGIGWTFILMDVVFALIPDLRFFAFAAFYTVMLALILLQTDEQCKFDTLLPMLPVSRKSVVLELYIFGWAYIALLSVLALGSQALIWSRAGYLPVDGSYLLMMSFDICIALVMEAVVLPVLLRYGTQKGRLILIVSIGLVTALSVGIISGGYEAIVTVLSRVRAWHLLLIGAALSALSVPLSLRCYKKRINQ